MKPAAAGMIRAARLGLGGLADLLMPNVCAGCSASGITAGQLCDSCNVELLSLVSRTYCPRCGSTLGPNISAREGGCWICPNPLPRFAGVTRLGPYSGPLRQAIRGMKYRRSDALRARLGAMLAEAVSARSADEDAPAFDLVMPVPMHWRRRVVRGCDHARMLGRAVARELGVPLGNELIRVRHTPQQVGLSRTQRLDNVRRAFAVGRTACVEGAAVLLVDDVTTTGATADEAARTLLRSRASRVWLAVLAKADPPRAYAESRAASSPA